MLEYNRHYMYFILPCIMRNIIVWILSTSRDILFMGMRNIIIVWILHMGRKSIIIVWMLPTGRKSSVGK
jgi:hypothetical protein